MFSGGAASIPQLACANDLRLLNRVIRLQFGGSRTDVRGHVIHFSEEFVRMFRSLRTDFQISDRTVAPLLAFAQAQALLERRSDMTIEELNVFRYVQWDQAGTGELNRLVNLMKRGVQI